MRLLIISYWYTPSVSPRAFRWSALAEHWAAQGHHVDVVTGWTPGLQRREVLNGVHLHRPGVHIRGALRELGRWLRDRSAAAHPEVADQSVIRASVRQLSASYRVARWLYDHTWKKVYWPDDVALWIRPAYAAARRLVREGRYDAVVSVSLPFTDHLVAARLHRAAPDLRWVVDVGDPFCFLEHTPTNNQQLYRRLNYRVERRVFRAADAVSVTTEGTRDIYAELFPESADKIRVIPPLLPAPEALTASASVFPDDGKLRLVFAGNLYRTIREPDYLLRLFAALLQTELGPRLELHLLGNVRDCWESFTPYESLVDRKIFLHGMVSRGYALQAMSQASVLVNIGNSTAYQLPSKVVEYVSLAKPVLNVVRVPDDSSAAFFRPYPAATTVVGHDDPLTDAEVARVRDFLLSAREVDQETVEATLLPHGVDAIAGAYEELLREGVGGEEETRARPARIESGR